MPQPTSSSPWPPPSPSSNSPPPTSPATSALASSRPPPAAATGPTPLSSRGPASHRLTQPENRRESRPPLLGRSDGRPFHRVRRLTSGQRRQGSRRRSVYRLLPR